MAAQIIQTFSFETNSQIRTILDDNNEPLFCLVDVCNILQLTTPSRTKEQIEEEFGDGVTSTHPIIDRLGREQNTTFITEPQLYFVMMRSRAKVARQFRQWIVNEVLPALRKRGHYEVKEVKPVKTDEFSDKDMILIKEVLYRFSSKFDFDQAFRNACWYALRSLTGVKSPHKLRYSDLEVVAEELKRIGYITWCYMDAKRNVEQELCKKILRERGDNKALADILGNMITDAASDEAVAKLSKSDRYHLNDEIEAVKQQIESNKAMKTALTC